MKPAFIPPKTDPVSLRQETKNSASYVTQTAKSVLDADNSEAGLLRTCFLCQEEKVDPGVVFHRFPRIERLRVLWKKICNLSEDEDVCDLRLCSNHFKPENYSLPRGTYSSQLICGALPSLLVPNPPYNCDCQEPDSQCYGSLAHSVNLDPQTLSESNPSEDTEANSEPDMAASKFADVLKYRPDDRSASEKNTSIVGLPEILKANEVPAKKNVNGSNWRACYLCDIREPKNSDIAFHKFPSNPKICKLWKQACNLTGIDDVSTLKICSMHFKPNDYLNCKAKVLKLKPGRVPSIGVPNTKVRSSGLLKHLNLKHFVSSDKNKSNVYISKHGRLTNVNPFARVPNTFASSAMKPMNVQRNKSSYEFPSQTSVSNSPQRAASKATLGNMSTASTTMPANVSSGCSSIKFISKISSLTSSEQTSYDSPPQKVVWKQNLRPVVRPQSAFKEGEPRVVLKRLSSSELNKYLRTEEVKMPLPLQVVIKEEPTEEDSDVGDSSLNQKRFCYLCNRKVDETVSLHKFPTRPFMCSKWKMICGLKEDADVTHLKICSQHFKSIDYVETGPKHMGGKIQLLWGAVPSVRVPNSGQEDFDPLAAVRIENVLSYDKESDVWDASNLLEVIVNESSQPLYFDSEDLRNEDGSETTQRSCFLCNVKEEGKIFSPKSLHKFPVDEDMRRLWKRVCYLLDHDYVNTSSLLICSNHFTEEDYVAGTKLPGRTPVLRREAVPSVQVPNPPQSAAISHRASREHGSSNTCSRFSSLDDEDKTMDSEITVKEEPILNDEFENGSTNSWDIISNEVRSPPNTQPLLRLKSASELLSKRDEDLKNPTRNNEQSTPNSGISEKDSVTDRVNNRVGGPLSRPVSQILSEPPALPPTFSVGFPTTFPLAHSVFQPGTVPVSHSVFQPGTVSVSHSVFQPRTAPPVQQVVHIISNPATHPESQLASLPISPSVSHPMAQPAVPTVSQPSAHPVSQPVILGRNPFVIKHQNVLPNPSFVQTQRPTSEHLNELPNMANMPRKIAIPSYGVPKFKFLKIVPAGGITMEPKFQRVSPLNFPTPAPNLQTEKSNSVGHSINTLDSASPQGAPGESRQTELTNEQHQADVTSSPLSKRRCLSETKSSDTSTSKAPGTTLKTYHRSNSKTHLSEEQIARVKRCVRSFDDLLIHLQKRDMLSRDAADSIAGMVSEKSKEAISKKLEAGEVKWTEELRTFPLTLHLLSADAYNYLNYMWPAIFVHDGSIFRYWSRVEGGKPGFCREILDALFLRKSPLCNLSISEVPLRQEMLFENNRFYGGVDLGSDRSMKNDNMVQAQNVLMFFVNSLDSQWRAPVGYFLIRSLNSKERANLLVRCLELLSEAGVIVLSVTIDGSLVNISMCSHLGANFTYGKSFQPWILHPLNHEKIFIFWDPCCMMKLVRDTLGDKGFLLDNNQKLVKWSHIKELAKLQAEDFWHMDTKLTDAHVNYQQRRSDLRLCLQTLSRSVYMGIMTTVKKKGAQSKGGADTAMFCLLFNSIFDMLNSRSKFTRKITRTPITERSVASLRKNASVYTDYIVGIRDGAGTKILKTPRKTGFLGLIVCLTNIFEVYNQGKYFGLTCLYTHKLSLDYARTFFCAIQGEKYKNRFLNAKEFEERFQTLVLKRRDIFEKTDILIDGIDILKVLSQKQHYMDPVCNYQDGSQDKLNDFDYFKSVSLFAPIEEEGIQYISGFVVGEIFKKPICSVCVKYLINFKESRLLAILKSKKPREYYVPSEDVCNICKTAERVLRENKNLELQPSNINLFVIKTYSRVFQTVFNTKEMKAHCAEQDSLDNHMIQLCKLVIETFLNMRMVHGRR